MKSAGIKSIVFGVIAIAMTGVLVMGGYVINVILVLLGIFLFIEGIWVCRRASVMAIITDGVVLLIFGTWNIYTFINNISATSATFAIPAEFSMLLVAYFLFFFVWVGIWPIISGFESLGCCKRFSDILLEKPSEESLKLVDEIVESITIGKSINTVLTPTAMIIEEVADIVEFQTFGKQNWKGRFLEKVGVFVKEGGQDVLFAKKESINFTMKRKVLIGKSLEASFQIGNQTMTGIISPEFFKRYEVWKSAAK